MSFPGRSVQQAWHLVNAESQTVGRLATQVASLLKGKHKPTYRPNSDCGDFVVVVNAEKVDFSGKKWKDKLYRWHTGYPGGLKQRRAEEQLEKHPELILKKAILGMLTRNKLRHGYLEKRLRIYTGETHPHTAQLPPDVPSLPTPPRANTGTFHFGLNKYSEPTSYQVNSKK
uniref:50S ribosomal protein L13, chloroplastic n=1 Tax=Cyclophora tenuis TaxID=216820 RepID=A0A7S1CY61_CYCTE|mmetsp:Transcript_12207/g.20649  ORF Transcript_12207/g.20649 Transcript_12207/m.20649 type:complete len:172 (+) Transcript_12207:60-575(+)